MARSTAAKSFLLSHCWNVSYDDQGAVQLGHSGAFALGAGTAVSLLPSERLGIIVLGNGSPVGLAESITLSFMDIARTGSVQNDYLAILQPIFAGIMAPAYGNDVDYSGTPNQLSPAQELSTYTGTYANDLYGPMVIAESDGVLSISQGPAPETYGLTHWDRDTFTYLPIGENQNATSAVTFTIGPDGMASKVLIENLDIHGQGTFRRVMESN